MKTFCIISDERAYRTKLPTVFSYVLKKTGIRAYYVPFKVMPEDIGSAVHSLRILNIDGANIAVPYKEAVLPYMDVLSEGANIIRAVNTVTLTESGIKGYNTNAIGFMDTLEETGFDPAGKSSLVFGTGGASKAVIFILNWLRAGTITVAGRRLENLETYARMFGCQTKLLNDVGDNPPQADIIINTTPVSGREEDPKIAELTAKLSADNCELVIDLNYDREYNVWKEMAAGKGIRFVDGLTVLSHSARRTLMLWTRVDVEPHEFIKALESE